MGMVGRDGRWALQAGTCLRECQGKQDGGDACGGDEGGLEVEHFSDSKLGGIAYVLRV